MADNGKLWFEMGVRDKVEAQMQKDIEAAHRLGVALEDASDTARKLYSVQMQNAAKLEQAYYGIDKSIERVNKALKSTADADERQRLNGMLQQLEQMRKAFDELASSEERMKTKGSVAAEMLNQNYSLALRQVNEYTKGVTSSYTEEEKRVHRLRERYNELAALRERLAIAIGNAPAGADLTAASLAAGRIWSHQMLVAKNIKNGKDMTFGTDYRALKKEAEDAAKSLDKVAAAAEKERKAIENEANRQAIREMAELGRVNEGLVRSFDRVTAAGQRQGRMMRELETMMTSYLSLYGLKSFLSDTITRGGAFEVQRVALQNILGDLGEANRLFEQLKALAIESPMTFSQIAGYTKQLAAYSIPSDELFDTTKRLADLSTGLGVDMGRLILAYGQVRSAAVLRGQELRQFTEAGIPLVQRLAEKFTELNGEVVKTGDVFELISKRKVPFEMVRDILWDMTDEGGQFYNMQYHIAETLSGKWQKLSDAYEQFLGKIAAGNTISGAGLKLILTTLTDIVKNAEHLLPIAAGIGGAFAGRGIKRMVVGFASAGSAGLFNNIEQARKENALLIEREHILGRIDATRRAQLLAHNAEIKNNVLALTQAGRLNTMQLTGLYLKGKIKKDTIDLLLLEKAITAEEAKQITTTTQWGLAKMRVKALLGGISGSFLTTLGIGVAVSAAISFTNHLREAREAYNQLRDDVLNTSMDKIRSSQSILNMEAPESSKDYVDRIGAMSEYLRENASGLQDVAFQSEHTGDSLESLKARYDELKTAVEAVNKANKDLSEDPAFVADLVDKSGSNLWIGPNLEIDERLKKAEKRFTSFKHTVESIGGTDARDISNALDEIRSKYADFAKAVVDSKAENSLSAQLELLMRYGDAADAFKGLVGNNGAVHDIVTEWALYQKELNNIEKSFSNIENVFATKMRAKFGLGIDMSNLEGEAKEYANSVIAEIVKQSGITTEAAISDFYQRLQNRGWDVSLRVNIKEDEKALTGWKKKIDEALSGPDGKGYYTTEIRAMSNISEVLKFIQDKHKEVKERMDATAPIAIKFGIQLDNDKKKFTGLDRMAWNEGVVAASEYNADAIIKDAIEKLAKSLGLNPVGKSEAGSSKKADAALEKAKTRLDEVKKFYAEYKKYRDVYGDEKGLSLVEGIFGMKPGEGRNIVENYKGTLNDILNMVSSKSTEARKKFITSIRQLEGEMGLDEEKKKIERDLNELKEWLSKKGKQFNLYESILEKTGDKTLAETAFSDVRVWDEQTRALEQKLKEVAPSLSITDALYGMSDTAAKEFFENNKGAYEIWKQVVELTQKNYTTALNDIAKATADLLTTDEKIAKVEAEITRLQEKGANENDVRVIAKQKELRSLRAQLLEESEAYIRFYSAILTMGADEAEDMGTAIRENLVRQLADGTINADKYLKSIKNIDSQLSKMRSQKSLLGSFAGGGVSGVLSTMNEQRNDDIAASAARLEQIEKNLTATRKALGVATERGDEHEAEMLRSLITRLEAEKEEAIIQQKKAEKTREFLGVDDKALTKINEWLAMADMVIGAIEGIAEATKQFADMFEALGKSDSAARASDVAEGISAAVSPLNSAIGAIKNVLNGNIGGAISGIVGVFTAPITAFAKLHDKRRQREIDQSISRVNALTTAYQNLENAIAKSLGGIYTAGGYDEMRENMQKQREEIAKQLSAEQDKKDPDKGKIEEYKQKLKEADEEIKRFAEEMAKALYGIDVKSWAREFGDALFDAWKKGENGAEAFKKKAKDIIADVTKSIVVQKIIETALNPVLDIISEEMNANSGKLTESAVLRIANALGAMAGPLSDSVYKVYDAVDNATSDLGSWKDEADKASSGTSAIKSITEDQTNLLLSYINAMRADLSVHVERFRQFMEAIMPGLSNQFALQLAELKSIEANTRRSADGVERIYDLLDSIQSGVRKLSVKVYAA